MIKNKMKNLFIFIIEADYYFYDNKYSVYANIIKKYNKKIIE